MGLKNYDKNTAWGKLNYCLKTTGITLRRLCRDTGIDYVRVQNCVNRGKDLIPFDIVEVFEQAFSVPYGFFERSDWSCSSVLPKYAFETNFFVDRRNNNRGVIKTGLLMSEKEADLLREYMLVFESESSDTKKAVFDYLRAGLSLLELYRNNK